MANISDYLDWRGDIPFTADPFNEVDNLILSELAYTNFEGIVPDNGLDDFVDIKDVCKLFFEKYTDEEIMAQNSSTKVAPFLMKKMIDGVRFNSVKLCCYINDIDQDKQSQFSVVTYILPDGSYFVAFRGTDNTIVGWKEDFNMSFMYETEGQLRAAEYLNAHFKGLFKKLRVGGHSKGGNFAVFASAFCEPDISRKIINVYCNDGPGFLPEIMKKEGYQNIKPKVISTLPEESVVGILLENEMDNRFVLSSQKGPMQHDPMSWQVLRNRFVLTDNLKESSVMLDKTLKNWIYGLKPEERKEFVDTLFGILESSGALTLDDLTNNKMKSMQEMSKFLKDLSPEQQTMMGEVVKRFISSGNATIATTMQSNMDEFQNRLHSFLRNN